MPDLKPTQKTIRVLVSGGRDYAHRDKVMGALYELLEVDDDNMMGKNHLVIIHGFCTVKGKLSGADRWADEFAVVHWCGCERYPANFAKYGSYAGFYRNQQMIDEGKPDIALIFPGGRGTEDMKVRAINSGIEVREFK